jgi:hypothetical protein
MKNKRNLGRDGKRANEKPLILWVLRISDLGI